MRSTRTRCNNNSNVVNVYHNSACNFCTFLDQFLLPTMVNPFSTRRFHVAWMYGECAHEQHLRRTLTLTLTHTITAYSVSENVVRVRILICATRQKPCRKSLPRNSTHNQPLCVRRLKQTVAELGALCFWYNRVTCDGMASWLQKCHPGGGSRTATNHNRSLCQCHVQLCVSRFHASGPGHCLSMPYWALQCR